jgi:RNA polymerase sigma factor (sigma-70 family)
VVARDAALLELTDVVRRTLLARIGDHHLVEDLTQEAIVKVASARGRLDDDALRAYAIVTARNTLTAHFRQQATRKRHAHRLVEYRGLDGPEQLTLEREETDALAAALDRLDDHDRQLLVAHESDGVPLDELAARHDTTPRAISMRLARARAVMRVEFVLALRHIGEIPNQCRNNLLALSAGDKRRQDELGTADHLSRCETCSQLSKPIVQRRRGIAVWLFLASAELLRRFLGSLRRNHVTQAVSVAGTAAMVAVAFLVLQPDRPASPAATDATTDEAALRVPGSSLAPATAPEIASTTAAPTTLPASAPPAEPCSSAAGAATIDATLDTCPFTLNAALVIEVPADEGFWISAPDGQPAWVHIVGTAESPQHVEAGHRVTLTGVVRANSSVTSTGAPAEVQPQVDLRAAHLEVTPQGLSTD